MVAGPGPLRTGMRGRAVGSRIGDPLEVEMIRGVSHIALTVADVEAAERYYCDLFEMTVAFRDVHHGGRQASLRPGVDWATAKARGVEPGLSSLFRDGFTLALEQGQAPGAGALNHLGLDVDQTELERISRRAPAQRCQVVARRADLLVFVDAFGIRWEMTTARHAAPADASTGARLGEWLDFGE